MDLTIPLNYRIKSLPTNLSNVILLNLLFFIKNTVCNSHSKTLDLFRVSLAKRLGLTVVFSKIKTA